MTGKIKNQNAFKQRRKLIQSKTCSFPLNITIKSPPINCKLLNGGKRHLANWSVDSGFHLIKVLMDVHEGA